MVGKKAKTDSRMNLWVVFGGLCVLIVGLVVAIVMIAMNNNSNEEQEVVTSQDTGEIVTEEEMKRWEEEYNDFEVLYNEVTERARDLLDDSRSNVAGVYALYNDTIDKYMSQERFDYVWAFVEGERDVLIEAGLSNEALQAMMQVDYDKFPEARQYESYMQILRLAESLNDEVAVDKYEKLVSDTKGAWDSVQEAAEEKAVRFESEIDTSVTNESDEKEGE